GNATPGRSRGPRNRSVRETLFKPRGRTRLIGDALAGGCSHSGPAAPVRHGADEPPVLGGPHVQVPTSAAPVADPAAAPGRPARSELGRTGRTGLPSTGTGTRRSRRRSRRWRPWGFLLWAVGLAGNATPGRSRGPRNPSVVGDMRAVDLAVALAGTASGALAV